MYLRVAVPSYRYTDDRFSNDQHISNSDFSYRTNGTLNSSDHAKNGSPMKKGHVVYDIEVVSNNFGDPESGDYAVGESSQVPLGQGRVFHLEKRYSAFLTLHNELRKHYSTPEFPPKRIRNTSHKVLSIRREHLERYMQYVVKISPIPTELLDFLQVSEQYSSCQSFGTQDNAVVYSNDGFPSPSNEMCQHQPVLGFKSKEPFLYATSDFQSPSSLRRRNHLPDIVTQATLEYFYSS